jgi:hypothetical protein
LVIRLTDLLERFILNVWELVEETIVGHIEMFSV